MDPIHSVMVHVPIVLVLDVPGTDGLSRADKARVGERTTSSCPSSRHWSGRVCFLRPDMTAESWSMNVALGVRSPVRPVSGEVLSYVASCARLVSAGVPDLLGGRPRDSTPPSNSPIPRGLSTCILKTLGDAAQ